MSARVLLYAREPDYADRGKLLEKLALCLDRERFEVVVACSDGSANGHLHLPPEDKATAEQVIRRIAPDIFHSFSHEDIVDIAAAAAAGVPVILASRFDARERAEVQQWERERTRFTHRIIAFTEAAASACETVEGISRQNIVDVPRDAVVECCTASYEEALAARAVHPRAQLRHRRPVRVLLHLDYLWLGGLEKQVANVALRLDRSRFEPIVSWHRRWGRTGEELRRAGVLVVPIAPAHGEGRAAAIEQIRELAPEIFHSFSCRLSSADVLNARAAGVPIVVTSRSGLRPQEQGPVHAWEQERNRATDRIVACGRAIAASNGAGEDLPVDALTVILNGVVVPDNMPRPARRREICIGYAATWRVLKGHDILLRAFQKLAKRHPDLHLLCCGEKYDDTMARAGQVTDLPGTVQLLDAQQDMDAIYAQMDIYAHASLSEGFSNSILEAMAHGLPVVASSVGGNREQVIHGETGLLVPPGDSDALADALEHLVSNESLRLRIGRAGYERVKTHFPMAAMVRGYEALYEELIARESRAAADAVVAAS